MFSDSPYLQILTVFKSSPLSNPRRLQILAVYKSWPTLNLHCFQIVTATKSWTPSNPRCLQVLFNSKPLLSPIPRHLQILADNKIMTPPNPWGLKIFQVVKSAQPWLGILGAFKSSAPPNLNPRSLQIPFVWFLMSPPTAPRSLPIPYVSVSKPVTPSNLGWLQILVGSEWLPHPVSCCLHILAANKCLMPLNPLCLQVLSSAPNPRWFQMLAATKSWTPPNLRCLQILVSSKSFLPPISRLLRILAADNSLRSQNPWWLQILVISKSSAPKGSVPWNPRRPPLDS